VRNIVELIGVTKNFGDTIAVDNIDLKVRKGEFITLLGPSGCGKTTTLRLIAGFIRPDKGYILINGERMENKAPYERNLGMVFQNYALFPHMTVYENIAFGLKMRKVNKVEIDKKVKEYLELVQLPGIEKRYPRQLSGGQQQRVALARALVIEPEVLLLDEPLSNLDLKLREAMRLELKAIHERVGITFIYVTHDQGEALAMSDRLAIMNKGKIMQVGTPEEVYERPINRFVAEFIGETNILEGKVTKIDTKTNIAKISVGKNFIVYASTSSLDHERLKNLIEGAEVRLSIRPQKIRIERNRTTKRNSFLGKIKHAVYLGSTIKYHVQLDDVRELVVDMPTSEETGAYVVGKEVYVEFAPEDCLILL